VLGFAFDVTCGLGGVSEILELGFSKDINGCSNVLRALDAFFTASCTTAATLSLGNGPPNI